MAGVEKYGWVRKAAGLYYHPAFGELRKFRSGCWGLFDRRWTSLGDAVKTLDVETEGKHSPMRLRCEAEEQVQEALHLAGHSDLDIHVSWSPFMTRTLGKAIFVEESVTYEDGREERVKVDMEIRFSAKAWPLLPPEERKQGVFHEVAHIVAFVEADSHEKAMKLKHGPEWLEVMERIGYPNAPPSSRIWR